MSFFFNLFKKKSFLLQDFFSSSQLSSRNFFIYLIVDAGGNVRVTNLLGIYCFDKRLDDNVKRSIQSLCEFVWGIDAFGMKSACFHCNDEEVVVVGHVLGY